MRSMASTPVLLSTTLPARGSRRRGGSAGCRWAPTIRIPSRCNGGGDSGPFRTRHTVLEPIDEPVRPADFLASVMSCHLTDATENVGVAVDFRFHLADVDHGLRKACLGWRRANRAHRQCKHVIPGAADVLDLGVRQWSLGLGIPDSAEPIDHDGVAIDALPRG